MAMEMAWQMLHGTLPDRQHGESTSIHTQAAVWQAEMITTAMPMVMEMTEAECQAETATRRRWSPR